MAPRLPSLIAVLLAALPAASVAQAPLPCPLRCVIAADEIRQSGALRLGDLLQLVAGWDATTVDGWTWNASPRGLGSPRSASWLVIVDGQRVELGRFGLGSLERLPVPLAAIDSVELSSVPTLADGELATSGVIRVFTARPQGVRVHGWVGTGSEVGDPGPFAFTPDATPNVDRLGHDGSAGAGYGTSDYFAAGDVVFSGATPTDPAIAARYTTAAGGVPRIEARGGRFRAAGRLGRGTHQLALLRLQTDGFVALPTTGRELAVDETFSQLSLDGAVPLGGAAGRYEIAIASSEAEAGAAPPIWDINTAAAAVGLSANDRPGAPSLELRAERRSIGWGSAGASVAVSVLRLGGSVDVRRGERYALKAGAEIGAGGGGIGAGAALEQRAVVSRRTNATLVLAFTAPTPADRDDLWAWIVRNYSPPSDAGVTIVAPSRVERARRFSADLAIESSIRPWLQIGYGGFWRSAAGLPLEREVLTYDPGSAAFSGTVDAGTEPSGSVGAAELGVMLRPSGSVSARLDYRWQRPLGDADFRRAWRVLPAHVMRFRVAASPTPDVDLRLFATYRSRSDWASYDGASDPRVRATLPSAFVVDATAQKWFWRRRLRGLIGVRNVFGAPLSYHGAGATWDPALLLQGEARWP